MTLVINSLPIFFFIIGLILMKWDRMKDWKDVGYVLFAAGAFALAFLAPGGKTFTLFK